MSTRPAKRVQAKAPPTRKRKVSQPKAIPLRHTSLDIEPRLKSIEDAIMGNHSLLRDFTTSLTALHTIAKEQKEVLASIKESLQLQSALRAKQNEQMIAMVKGLLRIEEKLSAMRNGSVSLNRVSHHV